MIYRLYHGSDKIFKPEDIEVYCPRYEGSLGQGIYFCETPEGALFYGQHLYVYDVEINNPLIVSPDSLNYRIPDEIQQHLDETGAFNSILVGESIIPFDVRINETWYEIRDGVDLMSLGDLARENGHDALIIEGLREGTTSENGEVLIFDKGAIRKAYIEVPAI